MSRKNIINVIDVNGCIYKEIPKDGLSIHDIERTMNAIDIHANKEWRFWPKNPNYIISNMGDVIRKGGMRKLKSGNIIKIRTILVTQFKNQMGYPCIVERITPNRKFIRVHRMVADTFIPNPANKPYINHINGIKDDNRIDNLEWCTHKENMIHAFKMGLSKSGEKSVCSKLKDIDIQNIRDSYKKGGITHKEIANMYNVSRALIGVILNNKHRPLV